MSLNRLHVIVIAAWFTTLGAVLAGRFVAGIPFTLAESIGVVFLGSVPVVILLAVFRGAGPRNVTQMLYDVDRNGGEAVRLRARTDDAGPGRGRR